MASGKHRAAPDADTDENDDPFTIYHDPTTGNGASNFTIGGKRHRISTGLKYVVTGRTPERKALRRKARETYESKVVGLAVGMTPAERAAARVTKLA